MWLSVTDCTEGMCWSLNRVLSSSLNTYCSLTDSTESFCGFEGSSLVLLLHCFNIYHFSLTASVHSTLLATVAQQLFIVFKAHLIDVMRILSEPQCMPLMHFLSSQHSNRFVESSKLLTNRWSCRWSKAWQPLSLYSWLLGCVRNRLLHTTDKCSMQCVLHSPLLWRIPLCSKEKRNYNRFSERWAFTWEMGNTYLMLQSNMLTNGIFVHVNAHAGWIIM